MLTSPVDSRVVRYLGSGPELAETISRLRASSFTKHFEHGMQEPTDSCIRYAGRAGDAGYFSYGAGRVKKSGVQKRALMHFKHPRNAYV